MTRLSAALLLLPLLPATAWAETGPATEKLLWCASAFYWLAASAGDAGDHEEAALYDGWSKSLLERARAGLAAAGATPEQIEDSIARSDEAALEELGTDAARYDVVTCPDLVEPATGPQP